MNEFLRDSHQGTEESSIRMSAQACSFVDMRECRVTPLVRYAELSFRQRRPRRIADAPTTFNPAA
jgi:hypothetical protein